MKKALVVAAIASALSGCGKDNYDGTYSGYAQPITSASQYQVMDQRVELNLKHDKDIVSGTISYLDTGMQGQFSASSENSNKLDNVEIRLGYSPQMYQGMSGANMMYGMACFGVFTGSLDAPGDGKRLRGTLNSTNTSVSTVGGYSAACTGQNISVNKN